MDNLAKIPYIQHEYRMFKAYQRENKLKIMLVACNLIWLTVFVLTR